MASTTKGYGTIVQYATTLTGSYTTLAQCRDMNDGAVTIEEVDVSHMSSPDQFREKETDWGVGKNFTLNLLYFTTHYQILWNLAVAKSQVWWKITTPDSKIYIFYGFISDIGREIPLAGRLSADVEFVVSGKPLLS